MKFHLHGLAARLLTFFVLILASQSTSSADENKNSNISSYTLENGLQLVVIPDRRAPVVTHIVWYKVGGADDPPGKSGLAHFLEHLMFKGTKTKPAGEFSRKIAEIGGRENAFTSADYTGFFQKIAPSALKMVMDYEADRMVNLVLTDEVVNPELEVVQEERRQRISNSPGAILGESSRAMTFMHHPYGTPIIGWEHEIVGLTKEDALEFYREYYRPSNAVVVVAGDIVADDVLELVKQTYGKIADNEPRKVRERLQEPQPTSARRISYADERVSAPSWRRTYLVPSYFRSTDREAEALDVLSNVLGGASTSRLHRILVLEKELATSIGAYYSGGTKDLGTFSISARPREGVSIDQLEAEIDAVLRDLLTNGIDEVELKRGQNNLIKTTIFDRDSQSTMARVYGAVLVLGGKISDIDDWPEEIQAISRNDVTDVANKFLRADRSVTSILLPKEATK